MPDRSISNRVEGAVEVINAGRPQKGVRFPKELFETGRKTERAATFDAAYDLACRQLGVAFVDVVKEENHLRFLPSLSGIG